MRLQLLVLDTPDPRASAAFYGDLLGVDVEYAREDWVQLVGETDGVVTLAFQLAPDLAPPDWPHGDPQRAHLDIEVDDLDAGERRALDAGARKATVQPGSRFTVFHDPTGHPFCLVLRRGIPTP